MADDQRPILESTFGYGRTRVSRRKVITVVAVLLLVVLLCVAAIGVMLERLETKNANFHPPMTSSERELLMPNEPRLEVAPSVGGLRYRDEEQNVSNDGDSPGPAPSADIHRVPLNNTSPKATHIEGLSHVH